MSNYKPGDVANGHRLNTTGQWVPLQADLLVKRTGRTIGILNFYRLLGTVILSVITVIGALIGLAIAVQSKGGPSSIMLTVVGVGLGVLSIALFYAVVGWLADTLALLSRIAGHRPQGA